MRGSAEEPWVKIELYFNLVEGQLYLLTYANECRGGPWAKNTLNQFHVAAPEFLRGREKRDVARSGEYLTAALCASCIICGISETFWCSPGKCLLVSPSSCRPNG